MMKNRKGIFSLADMSAVAVLLFIFAVFSEPMFQFLAKSFENATALNKLALALIPVGIIIAILSLPFALQEIRYENGGGTR